jgi:hypothetical protein
VWEKEFSSALMILDFKVDKNGDVITTYENDNGSYFVAKLKTSNGTTVWEKELSGALMLFDFDVDKNANIILNYYDATDTFWIVKIDPKGNVSWQYHDYNVF